MRKGWVLQKGNVRQYQFRERVTYWISRESICILKATFDESEEDSLMSQRWQQNSWTCILLPCLRSMGWAIQMSEAITYSKPPPTLWVLASMTAWSSWVWKLSEVFSFYFIVHTFISNELTKDTTEAVKGCSVFANPNNRFRGRLSFWRACKVTLIDV